MLLEKLREDVMKANQDLVREGVVKFTFGNVSGISREEGLVAIKPMVAALPVPGLWLLFGGGVSYTFGVLFYVRRSLRYHHAVWHMFVLGGSVLHYFAVLWYVLPKT